MLHDNTNKPLQTSNIRPLFNILASYQAIAKPAETTHSNSTISLDFELAGCEGR